MKKEANKSKVFLISFNARFKWFSTVFLDIPIRIAISSFDKPSLLLIS